MLNWLARLVGLRCEYFASYIVVQAGIITNYGWLTTTISMRIKATGGNLHWLQERIAQKQSVPEGSVLITSLTRL